MGIGQTELSRSSHFLKNEFKWIKMAQCYEAKSSMMYPNLCFLCSRKLVLSFEPAKAEIQSSAKDVHSDDECEIDVDRVI